MKYIPEEHILIDYLYGELKGEERSKVEQYLNAHPEVKQQVMGMQETREMMGKYENREVIVPEMFDEPVKSKETTPSIPHLKTILVMAASISLILLVGFFTELRMTYADNQLTIRFGDEVKQQIDKPNSAELIDYEALQTMIVKTMRDNQPEGIDQKALKSDIIETLQSVQEKNQQSMQSNINQFIEQEKLALESYSQTIQTKNKEVMEQYLATITLEQRVYLEDVLVDFTNYMEEQRLQDRQFYVNNLVDLKLKTDLQQQETEQMLTSIMHKVNEIPSENETQNF